METKKMWVPTIGDEITLTSTWMFGLYYEHRNEAMICFCFPGTNFTWRDMIIKSGDNVLETPEYGQKIADVELPAGAILKVDRIYIRKGGQDMKEFDSITFILQSIPDKKLEVALERYEYVQDGLEEIPVAELKYNFTKETVIDGKRMRPKFVRAPKKAMRYRVRFWAKLRDVNKIEFVMGREDIHEEEKPFIRRVIRFD